MARDAEKEKFWREKVSERKRSRLTVRQFCEQNQLREVQFFYWQRALKEKAEKKATGFVELVRPSDQNGTVGVSIRIDDRVNILLDRNFDEATLRSALAAVTQRS